MDFQIEEIARIPIRGFNLEEILFDINFTNVDRTFGEAWLLVENMIEDLVQKLRIKISSFVFKGRESNPHQLKKLLPYLRLVYWFRTGLQMISKFFFY